MISDVCSRTPTAPVQGTPTVHSSDTDGLADARELAVTAKIKVSRLSSFDRVNSKRRILPGSERAFPKTRDEVSGRIMKIDLDCSLQRACEGNVRQGIPRRFG